MDMAKAFQTDRVRCFDFWRLEDQAPYRAAINEKLRDAAAKAEKKGIILVLENESACNTATAAEAAKVLSAVQSPALMLNWDPGNAAASGEIPYPDGYNLLPKERIGHCHCKDAVKKGKGYDWAPMGGGVIDWVGPVQGAQARRLPFRREPGDALERRRVARRMFAQELGGNEETSATGGRVVRLISRKKREKWGTDTELEEDMTDHIKFDQTRRTFLKQAAMGTAAVLAYPASTVLGANDRVRVGMIGVGDRGNDLLGQILRGAWRRSRGHGRRLQPPPRSGEKQSARHSDVRRSPPPARHERYRRRHRGQPAAYSHAAFSRHAGRRERSVFREDHDLVDSGGRQVPGRGEGIQPRHPDRIAASEFRRADRREADGSKTDGSAKSRRSNPG